MKYLITGSTGLVGYAFKDAIINHIDHSEETVFLSSKDANLIDQRECDAIISKHQPHTVIHLAANVGGLYKNMKNKVAMFEDNIQMNTNIVKSCYNYGVKNFIGCLSTCVFPDKIDYPLDESKLYQGRPPDSHYGYAYAKRMMDIHCQLYREEYGLNYQCVVPTNIYGPNDNFRLVDAHVIPALINKCYFAKLHNKPLIINGTGSALRQFIFSYDLADIIIRIIKTKHPHKSIIVANPQEYSIKQIVDLICQEINFTNQIRYDTSYSDGQYRKTASINLLKDIIGDYQFTPLEEGISQTVKWFIDNINTNGIRV